MPQFGGQPVKEIETPVGGGHIPSEVFSVASNPAELYQILESLSKFEQTKFLDSLSDSHISGVMNAVNNQQMSSLQSFVTTFIVEAKRVEGVLTELLSKK